MTATAAMLGGVVSAQMFTVSADSEPVTVYSQDFEALGPKVILDHPMDSEDAINAVISGYEDMVTPASNPSTIQAGTAGGSSLSMTDNNSRYTSSGIRYDITDLVAGKSGQLTITADLRGGYAAQCNGKIGFITGEQVAAADAAGSANSFIYDFTATTVGDGNGAFTTVTYTVSSVPSADKVYFFASTGNPTLNIKNIKITLEDSASTDSRITQYANSYTDQAKSSISAATHAGVTGNYLALSYYGADSRNGAIVDLSELNIENKDKLTASFKIATDGDNLSTLFAFILSTDSVDSAKNYITNTSQWNKAWLTNSNGGYNNSFGSSKSYEISFTIDEIKLESGQNPYLVILDNNATIYLDDIKVDATKAEPEVTTHDEGFEFSKTLSLAELQAATITLTAEQDGKTATSEPLEIPEVSGEGSAVIGIVITDIPSGTTIKSVNIE